MRIAVTGATGTIGGLVVSSLADEHDVVAVTRRPREEGSDRGTTAIADYDDLPALRRAFDGVDSLVFVSSDGEAARVLNHHANVVRAASDARVGQVVYLSGLDADLGSPFCYAYTNGQTERLLAESSLPTAVARASIFTEFFVARFVAPARESGLRLPMGTGRVSLVAQADVARCLAALAVSPVVDTPHAVTGAESVDVAEVAGVVSRTGTPMHGADISPADFDAALTRAGEEPWWTYAFSSMFASIRMHRWAATSDAVARLTGRTPLALSDVLEGAESQALA